LTDERMAVRSAPGPASAPASSYDQVQVSQRRSALLQDQESGWPPRRGACVPIYSGTALLLESDELIARLEHMLDEVQQRAEQGQQRAEDEVKRRESAERELVELREELTRLKALR
jgi:hypothetical protein